MPTLSQTIQMRNKSRESARRSPARWLGLGAGILISLAIAVALIYLAADYASLTQDLPSVEALPALLDAPGGLFLQPTRIYDRSGTHLLVTLQNPAAGARQFLYYPGEGPKKEGDDQTELLPTSLITATIASSEITPTNTSLSSAIGYFLGASPSIGERLAASFLLENEPDGWRRAMREKLLAVQIVQVFGEEKTIEWYLNSADFGRMAYGAQQASQLYFGKPAHELDFSEAAFLVAMAENSTLKPVDDIQVALTRQKEIIQEALRGRMLTPTQGVNAVREEVKITPSAMQDHGDQFIIPEADFAPAFLQLVLEQVTSRIPRQELERGGLRIFTTLDYELQAQLSCTSRVQLDRIKTTQNENPAGIPSNCQAARLLPSLTLHDGQPAGNLALESLALDPLTGQILAMNSSSMQGQASALLSEHQPGSLGTFFVYATGFTRGLSPGSLMWDIPAQEGSSAAENFNGEYHGPVRLRIALANDYLAPAESVLAQVGVENVWRTSRQLGLQLPESDAGSPQSVLSLFRPLNLLETSHAVSAFANQGNLAGHAIESKGQAGPAIIPQNAALPSLQPVSILRAEDTNGHTRLDWSEPQSRPILSPSLAYLMTNVLSDETARWPRLGHPNPLEIGRPAAAKIGGTADGESNWVIGYTPKRVVGVWIGPQTQPEEPVALSLSDMRNAAAGLWHAVMQYANQDLPYEDFSVPPGLSIVQVCDPSGLLPTVACPNVVDEVFLNGNEPTQIDTLYHLVAINRDTGRLATIFTPPDLVEERAFISVPPEAKKWASQTGLETPPEMYDVLEAQTLGWPDTKISAPQMFANLRGKTTITGRATGAGFSFYRMQFGKGPDPNEWFQIGADALKPVPEGALAVWDTTGLDGLYAVQLLVVRNDQSAERATILVTIDNLPPKIEITQPIAGQTIMQSERSRIVLQAEISDNLEIASVTFKMDGQPIATLLQAPYALSWTVTPGQHTFQVSTTDNAGNEAKAETDFSVK